MPHLAAPTAPGAFTEELTLGLGLSVEHNHIDAVMSRTGIKAYRGSSGRSLDTWSGLVRGGAGSGSVGESMFGVNRLAITALREVIARRNMLAGM